MTTRVPVAEVQADLAAHLDRAAGGTPLLVERPDGRNVVIVEEHEYEGLLETLHLLSSPANAAHLLDSIRQAERGQVVYRDVIELEDVPGRAA